MGIVREIAVMVFGRGQKGSSLSSLVTCETIGFLFSRILFRSLLGFEST